MEDYLTTLMVKNVVGSKYFSTQFDGLFTDKLKWAFKLKE